MPTIKGANGEEFTLANNPDLTPIQPTQPTPVAPQTTIQQATAMREAAPNLSQRDAIAKVEGNQTTETNPKPTNQVTPVNTVQQSVTPNGKATLNAQGQVQPLTTDQRAVEINKNLTEGLKYNPSLFTDQATFRKAYGYDTKPVEEQAQLDAFFTNNRPNTDSYMASFVAGSQMPANDTPEYKQAQAQYGRIQPYLTTNNPLGLIKAVDSGKLNSSDIAQIQKFNPALYQAYVQKKTVVGMANQVNSTIFPSAVSQEKMESTVTNMEKNVLGDINSPLYNAYKEYLQKDPRVVDSYLNYDQALKNKNEFAQRSAKIVADIESSYGNTLTDGAKASLAAKKINELKVIYGDPDAALETATTAVNNALSAGGFGYFVQDYDRTAQNNQDIEKKKQEFALAQEQQKQIMSNPDTAIPAVIDQYVKAGIMPSKSVQQHIADFTEQNQKYGTTLGQYISQMQRDFQAKPEYKAKFEKASTQDWQKLTDTTLYNQKTGEIRNLSGTSGGLPSSFTGDTTSYIAAKEGFRSQAYQDSAGVWTIGYGTTRINGKPVQPGQTITQAEAQKLLEEDIARHSNWKNFIDETTLSPSQRTALASFEYNLGPGIWEKSAMNIIDMVKSGDLAGAGREMQKYTNAGGRFVQGLANRRAEEAQLLMNTGAKAQGQKQFTDNDIALLSSVTKLDKQGKETLKDAGFTEQDWANFNAGLLPPTSAQKTDAQAVVDSIDDILGSDWTNAVGTWKGLPLPGTDRTVVEKKVDALIDNLAMSNLDKLKGPMSDKDIAFLRNTATYLSTDLSEDEFAKTLDLIKTKYAKIAGGVPKSQPLQPMQTNTGAGQISPQAQSIEQEWLNRNK